MKKILVFGSGVIGAYLAHVLCRAGNDVTVIARGAWADTLEKGLTIRHHLQRKTTVDHPRVIRRIDGTRYDFVFAVMPYPKMRLILDDLAALNCDNLCLVGNNLEPAKMQRHILSQANGAKKNIFFGFQATAGKKTSDGLICERMGASGMDIGHLHSAASAEERQALAEIFRGTGYKLNWQRDMEGYLWGHVAAIMPIGYAAYICGGDLTRTDGAMRRRMMDASREIFQRLQEKGVSNTEADAAWYRPGFKRTAMRFLYFVMAKNRTIGDLVACEHCRNAVSEMRLLDEKLTAFLGDTSAMPAFTAMKNAMPSWEALEKANEPAQKERFKQDDMR